ncbi:unnamed protein product [Ixodes hexagonus]
MQDHRTNHLHLILVILTAVTLLYIAIPRWENTNCIEHVNIVEVILRNQTEKTKPTKRQDPGSPKTKDYILHPPNLCMRGTYRIHLDYLVLIYSAPKNFDRRNAIRETWASELEQRSNSRVAFLLARIEDANVQRAIESESYLHADIIQGTFIDHYQNQTLKVKMMMRWALQYCPNISFLFKSDDDTFVNVGSLLKVMKNKRTDAVYGALHVNARPFREPSSLYYVSKEDYGGTIYPLFVGGAFYALGGSILRRLSEASELVPSFWLEDVFLTGFVAQKAGVDRINEKAITNYGMKTVCGALKKATSHYITAKMMRLFWYQIRYSQLKC